MRAPPGTALLLLPSEDSAVVDDKDDDARVRRRYGRMAGMGMQFGAAIIVFALVGHWLDGKAGTSPLLLVLGVLIGFAGGTMSLVYAVNAVRGDGDRP